jgi:hypothetical protein
MARIPLTTLVGTPPRLQTSVSGRAFSADWKAISVDYPVLHIFGIAICITFYHLVEPKPHPRLNPSSISIVYESNKETFYLIYLGKTFKSKIYILANGRASCLLVGARWSQLVDELCDQRED